MSKSQTLFRYLRQKWPGFKQNLKQNWFTYSLLCIVCLAILRKNYPEAFRVSKQAERFKVVTPQIFTDKTTQVQSMGLQPELPWAGDEQVSAQEAVQFFTRFRQTAIQEQKKYGIPASVILATAFVQSNGGKKSIATQKQNYFSLYCIRANQLDHTCFAEYATAWESFRAFSQIAMQIKGKKRLRSGKDWLIELEGSGVFPVGDFKDKALQVINDYGLQAIDAGKP